MYNRFPLITLLDPAACRQSVSIVSLGTAQISNLNVIVGIWVPFSGINRYAELNVLPPLSLRVLIVLFSNSAYEFVI